MLRLKHVVKVLTTSFLLVNLVSCNSAGSPAYNGGVTSPYTYQLGTIDNSGGAQLYATAESYTLSSSTNFVSGSIGITGGTPGFSGTLSLNITPMNTTNNLTTKYTKKNSSNTNGFPVITLSPCTLTAGGQFLSSCNFGITVNASTINGIYDLIPSFRATITGEAQQLNPIQITVTGGSVPSQGYLTITPVTESLIPNESTLATISLESSVGIFESIPVTITSSNTNVLTVTPSTCNLNTQINSCQVTVTALAAGNANLMASATNYPSNSRIFTVVKPSSYVYAANYEGTIAMYAINPNNGLLAPLVPPTVKSQFSGQGLAVDPQGRYLYVANSTGNSILMYRIESTTGQLTMLSPESVPALSTPLRILIDPTGHYLYATTNNVNIAYNQISMYAINRVSGLLTPLNPAAVRSGLNIEGISITPNGQNIYTVDMSNNIAYMYSVNSMDGQLSPLTPESTIVTGDVPYGITVSPNNRYAYVVNSSANTLSSYYIESSTGLLQPNGLSLATGNDPLNLTIDPTGSFLYVVNFEDSISMYSINHSTGLLTPLSTPVIKSSSAFGIAVEPTGRYAYVTNNSYLSMYSINQSNGILTSLNPATISTNGVPFDIAIATPSSNISQTRLKH